MSKMYIKHKCDHYCSLSKLVLMWRRDGDIIAVEDTLLLKEEVNIVFLTSDALQVPIHMAGEHG